MKSAQSLPLINTDATDQKGTSGSLTKGLNAMMKGQMDLKSAGMFFYGMQIVASVMGRVRFGEPEQPEEPEEEDPEETEEP
jgi:hypothetical protein